MVFYSHQNQMSHATMFPASHLMMIWTGIKKKIDILLWRMDTFLFLCVFFRTLLLLIHTSIHFRLFCSLFCLFLCFTNSFVFSPILFLTLMILLYFLNPPHWIIMTQYVLQFLLSLVYHSKISRILWILIFVKVISNSQFTIGFFKSSSVQ